jgi:hypothetical protein
MRRIAVSICLLAGVAPVSAQLTGVEGHVPPPTASEWQRIVGSYHLRVCRRGTRCVTDDDAGVQATLYVSIQRKAFNHQLRLGGIPSPDDNACYATVRIVRVAHPTIAGQFGGGSFPTKPNSQRPDISLVLGGSVDAFYIADVVVQDGRMEGTGRSTGSAISPDAAAPTDTVVGVRIGPPDLRPCMVKS